jgi:hypothetical protein
MWLLNLCYGNCFSGPTQTVRSSACVRAAQGHQPEIHVSTFASTLNHARPQIDVEAWRAWAVFVAVAFFAPLVATVRFAASQRHLCHDWSTCRHAIV